MKKKTEKKTLKNSIYFICNTKKKKNKKKKIQIWRPMKINFSYYMKEKVFYYENRFGWEILVLNCKEKHFFFNFQLESRNFHEK